MLYPSLSSNAKSLNLVSKDAYSPFYDIVWSFDYIINGTSLTEGGFTAFLCSSGIGVGDSEGGIDLGYSISPLKLNVLLDTSNIPQSSIQTENAFNIVVAEQSELDYSTYRHGGVLAVGFDSTGLFAASATAGPGATRDGLPLDKIYKNSVTVRGGFPKYSFNIYNFHKPLSSIDSRFKVIEDTLTYKTIRVRLGNVGRTIYVDYRYSPEEEFRNLISQDVTLNFATSTFYNAGISFASPISSIQNNRVGKMYLKNFHVEGTTNPDLNIYVPNLGTATTTTTTTTTTTPAPIIPPLPTTTTTAPPLGLVTLEDGTQIFTKNNFPIHPF